MMAVSLKYVGDDTLGQGEGVIAMIKAYIIFQINTKEAFSIELPLSSMYSC
jgi:hypothetical protein